MSWLDILLQVYEFFFGEILDGFVFDRPVGLLGSFKAMIGFVAVIYLVDFVVMATNHLVRFYVQMCLHVLKNALTTKWTWKTCDFNRPTNKKVL